MYITAWRNLANPSDVFFRCFILVANLLFCACKFRYMKYYHSFMKNTALFRTDGTWYNIMVDYFHHYKYVICLGVMRKSLPLFYGKESPLKSPPHPFVVLMISVLVSLILNTIILKKKTQVEMRFRARMGNRMAKGQPMLGKYNHPALEHAKPVGCHDSAFFIFQIFLYFQMMFVIFGCIYLHIMEYYIIYIARTQPDRLNESFYSMLLAIFFSNVWNLMCFVFPAVFFAGNPKRRRLFWKWIGQVFPCVRPWGQTPIQVI